MTKPASLLLLATAVAACVPAVEDPVPSTAEQPVPSAVEPLSAQDKAQIEQMLFAHETEWGNVAINRDTAVFDRILGDDLVYTTANGDVIGKAQMMENFANDPNTYTDAEITDLEAHWYADNVVLVIGVYREAGQDSQGNSVERATRFTNVWVEREGDWKCVIGHSTGDLS